MPRLFFISEGFVTGRAGMAAAEVCERTLVLVEAGVQAVQLRDHRAGPAQFAETAAAMAEALRAVRPDLVLSVNSRPEVAQTLGAALHVGRRGPSLEKARQAVGPDGLLGYSAHATSSARRAAQAGADYLFVSPLFDTPSHPGAPPRGLRLLRRCATAIAVSGVDRPPLLYALGGVDARTVPDCLLAGAHGVVSLSRLLQTRNPAGMVHAYLDALGQ